jgi:hypothetical protein
MATPPEVYTASVNAYYEGRYEEALGLVDSILTAYPKGPNLLSIAALANLRLNRDEAALALAERIFSVLPANPVDGRWPLSSAIEVIGSVHGKAYACGRYTGGRDYVLAGAGAIDPGAMERINRTAAFSIARFVGDPEIVHRMLRRLYPAAVGGDLPLALSPAETLRSWCARTGAIWGELEPRREVDTALGTYSRHYTAHAFAYGVIPGGEVLSGWDYALTGSGEILYDTNYLIDPIAPLNWFPHNFDKAAALFFHPWPQHVEYVDADVLFLSGAEHFIVGHWLCDFLPRLRVLGFKDMNQVKIGLPDNTPQKHRDLLSLFGITKEHIVECPFGRRFKFRNLIVVQPGFHAEPSPENTRFLAAGLRKAPAAGTKNTRIFLTRWANTRSIVNRDEVTALLQGAGFEFMDLAETSIADQQSRLAAADIAIAVYGSDLLSCLFMRPGTDFIAMDYLANTDPVTGALDSAGTGIMCSIIGVNFHVLPCVAVQVSAEARKKRDRDFRVDCGALQTLLDTIVNRRAN